MPMVTWEANPLAPDTDIVNVWLLPLKRATVVGDAVTEKSAAGVVGDIGVESDGAMLLHPTNNETYPATTRVRRTDADTTEGLKFIFRYPTKAKICDQSKKGAV
jgi:hypothetical protein